MYKLLILISILLISSCSCNVISTPEKYTNYGVDLSKYDDFLITPHQYNGKYSSISIVEYKFTPAVKRIDANRDTLHLYTSMEKYMESYLYDQLAILKIDVSRVLDSVYISCKHKGANAIIDFKIHYNTDDISLLLISSVGGKQFIPAKIPTIKITGYAIRRLE